MFTLSLRLLAQWRWAVPRHLLMVILFATVLCTSAAAKLGPMGLTNIQETFSNGDYEAVIAQCTSVIESGSPESADAYFWRGRATFSLNGGHAGPTKADFQAAADGYTEAGRDSEAEVAEAWYATLVGVEAEDWATVVDQTTRILGLDAEFAPAYVNRALARGYIGDKSGRTADLERAKELFLLQRDTKSYKHVVEMINDGPVAAHASARKNENAQAPFTAPKSGSDIDTIILLPSGTIDLVLVVVGGDLCIWRTSYAKVYGDNKQHIQVHNYADGTPSSISLPGEEARFILNGDGSLGSIKTDVRDVEFIRDADGKIRKITVGNSYVDVRYSGGEISKIEGEIPRVEVLIKRKKS